MLINQKGGVEHEPGPLSAPPLMDAGCLSAGLSVSQQRLIALLSGVWFTCTWTLSQGFLYDAQIWAGCASVNWGVGVGDRSTGTTLGAPTLPNDSQGLGRIFCEMSEKPCAVVFYLG